MEDPISFGNTIVVTISLLTINHAIPKMATCRVVDEKTQLPQRWAGESGSCGMRRAGRRNDLPSTLILTAVTSPALKSEPATPH